MIKSDDIKKYVNLTEIIESSESSKSKLSSFSNIVQKVTSTANLIENQRRDLSMIRKNVKKKIRAYRERKKTLKVLNIHILIIVDRINLLYLTDEDIVFKKLLTLKKRLTFTDRIKELEIVRKFQNLQNRVFKNQQINL
jgi:CO dehydrogenase/acetyl-CoA synthase beta subunit